MFHRVVLDLVSFRLDLAMRHAHRCIILFSLQTRVHNFDRDPFDFAAAARAPSANRKMVSHAQTMFSLKRDGSLPED